MNDNKNKSFAIVAVVLAVVVVGYVLWLSYANKKVRDVVQASAERIEQRLETDGKEASVTYDDVRVHGLSLRPRASVYKMHIKIEDPQRRSEMHVMVPEVVYTPKTFDMRSYSLEIIDSVSLLTARAGREQQNVLVDFSSSPAVHVSESKDRLEYSMDVPRNISLTNAAETEDTASADKTDITFDSDPVVIWSETPEGIGLDQKAVFPRIVITHGGQQMATVDSVSAETRHSAADGGMHHYDTMLKLENLVFSDKELEVLNPVNLINEVGYTGPVQVPGQLAPATGDQPLKVEVRNIAWMTGLVSVFASGNIEYLPAQEKMPYGKLTIRFDDIDRFLSYVHEQRPNTAAFLLKVRQVLERFSGAAIEEGGTVSINLNREKGGRLQIGELSLEEALGVFIELAMQLPDFSADEPKAEASEGEEGAVAKETAPEAEEDAQEEEAVEESAPIPAEPVVPDATAVPTKPTEPKAEVETNADDAEIKVIDEAAQEKAAEPAEAQPAPASQLDAQPEAAPQVQAPVVDAEEETREPASAE